MTVDTDTVQTNPTTTSSKANESHRRELKLSAPQRAAEWLVNYLLNKETLSAPSWEIKVMGTAAGFPESTLNNGRNLLGIESHKSGKKKSDYWPTTNWCLPHAELNMDTVVMDPNG